ncbi:MAG: Dam family site-specific DNA-(adenine-N6)-methyltransferase [Chloroflexia bacterium]|nr:Dam family site-specific DNA-(adenine-N6)-methyltransferase [Chloroflexia bacterium]
MTTTYYGAENSQFPIPNSQFPTYYGAENSQFPIPNSQFPIPNSQFPIPNSQFPLYIEPFIGAGALFFDLQPANAIICDKNELLVTTYTVIRDEIDELIRLLRQHSQYHNATYYYQIRAIDQSANYAQIPAVIKAARLIYLNKTCYNGLYRVNRSGHFNVPVGNYRDPLICDEPTLRAIHHYLNQCQITILHADYHEVLTNVPPKSLVYFDPPYHSPAKQNFTSYHADGFDEADQIALAATYRTLSQQGVYCLLSNADTPLMHELYADYTITIVSANRAINSQHTGRGRVNEVLVRNW